MCLDWVYTRDDTPLRLFILCAIEKDCPCYGNNSKINRAAFRTWLAGPEPGLKRSSVRL